MIQHKDHFHGSDLEKIEQVYGIKKEEITSFSANVNPLGISPRLRETLCAKIDCITSYPDRDYTALRLAFQALRNPNCVFHTLNNYRSCRRSVYIFRIYLLYRSEERRVGKECL